MPEFTTVVNSSSSQLPDTTTIDINTWHAAVEEFRSSCLYHGYNLVAIYDRDKRPIGRGWQHGHLRERLIPARSGESNTGILCKGLCVIDVDLDNAEHAKEARRLIELHLGQAPVRVRNDSSRHLLLYRAKELHKKKSVAGVHGKVEVLGDGQQFVGHGIHPGGAAYTFEAPGGPDKIRRADLVEVSSVKIAVLLQQLQLVVGTPAKVSSVKSTVSVLATGGPANAFACGTHPNMGITGKMPGWFSDLVIERQQAVVDRAIAAIPNEGPTDWDALKHMAMVIYGAINLWPSGDEDGLRHLQVWSRKHACHIETVTDTVWHEVLSSPPTLIGAGSIIFLAMRAGVSFHEFSSQATAAVPSTQTAGVILPPPISSMPDVMSEQDAIREMNLRFCFIHDHGGSAIYAMEDPTGRLQVRTKDELTSSTANKFVKIIDGGTVKLIPVLHVWQKSPYRRTYDRTDYDPENKRIRPGEQMKNLWTDFALKPLPGVPRRMYRHIRDVICGGNSLHTKYLIRWIAHCFQHPGTNPEVMVVLRSIMEGVGKSILGNWICQMLGRHSVIAAGPHELLGDFNEETDQVSFVLIEETPFVGQFRVVESLKALITSTKRRINPKNRRAYFVVNCLHMMSTTNGTHAITAGAGARRFFVLDVTVRKDPIYFSELQAEALGGGLGSALRMLLNVDLTNYDPRNVPVTRALVEQQRLSADDIGQWITDSVVENMLVKGLPNGGFGQQVPSHELRNAFTDWCTSKNRKHTLGAREFGRALGALRLQRGAGNSPPKWTIPDAGALLKASDRRSGIR